MGPVKEQLNAQTYILYRPTRCTVVEVQLSTLASDENRVTGVWNVCLYVCLLAGYLKKLLTYRYLKKNYLEGYGYAPQ